MTPLRSRPLWSSGPLPLDDAAKLLTVELTRLTMLHHDTCWTAAYPRVPTPWDAMDRAATPRATWARRVWGWVTGRRP